MKILVVGGGGREHALVWRLAKSGHRVIVAPGNPGMESIATCVPIKVMDQEGMIGLAIEEQVELVVVGPEAPLVAGLADHLRAAGIATFGPGASGARLEGSKVFSKQFFAKHGIRTAEFAVCATREEAEAAVARLGGDVVVKADGLAAGKGVVVCETPDEAIDAARAMLESRRFGDAGARIVIERKIRGREVSVLAITDGRSLLVLPAAEDHKTIFDGDRGPNTGGMGTVSPAWTPAPVIDRVERELLVPTVAGLQADGIDYRGVLYAGVMVAPDGTPWLLEYNCRFGDPETQPVMARWNGDLGATLAGAAAGALPATPPRWDDRTAVCVVVAAAGYPDTPRTGDPIEGLPADQDDLVVFHAGTARADGKVVSSGGRVLGVTALGDGVDAARARAYDAVARIRLDGMQFRRDIGRRGA
ncbi:MAG TPA: phosphoribosylamine--glycine ligase [Kofleriaceae bacterium]|nr:phosphoribosylamine--glycine ligase [Kofleriaceae bacterium]